MKREKQQIGFTLIELLIVIVIMGMLMSIIAPTMFSKVDSTKIKTAKMQMQMLDTALQTYRLDIGDYPEALMELFDSDVEGWDGPYLPKKVPSDPWGNDYVYRFPKTEGDGFLLLSYGKDGSFGGEGDAADLVYE